MYKAMSDQSRRRQDSLDALRWALSQLDNGGESDAPPQTTRGYKSNNTVNGYNVHKVQSRSQDRCHNPDRQRIVSGVKRKCFKDMTEEDFSDQIVGFVLVKAPSDLLNLRPYCHMVRYSRMEGDVQRFFGGGLLVKVDMPLNRYIVLQNCATKKTWSVQVHGSSFFVKGTARAASIQ